MNQNFRISVWLAVVLTPLLWVPCKCSAARLADAEGADNSNIVLQDWIDKTRNRDIPIKLYIPSSGSGPFPVVIFSHGLGGSRDAAEYLGRYWAEHGFLGVFIQHQGSDTGVWRESRSPDEFRQRMRSAANGENLIKRTQDVRFVLDELEHRSAEGQLKGKLDLSRLAVAGHSFGAGTSLALAGQSFGSGRGAAPLLDKRIKAAIYLCPPVSEIGKRNPQQAYGSIRIPGLLLTGTEDNSPIGNTTAKERRIPFDGIAAANQYFVNFYGADHATFGGRSFRAPKPGDSEFHRLIEEISTEFLQATLNNQRQAWQWLNGQGIKSLLKDSAQLERK